MSRTAERLLGRAFAEEGDSEIRLVTLQGSEDSADWDGVLTQNGTVMELTRIEGSEIWSKKGQLLDNQAERACCVQSRKMEISIQNRLPKIFCLCYRSPLMF